MNALISLLRAADGFSTSLNRELAGKGVTPSQFGVLECLLHLGPLCQGELAGKLLRSGGSVTSVVDGLERRKLVERRREPDDKRFVRVALTGEGKRLIAGLFPGHARRVAAEFAALKEEEQEELRRLCRKLGLSMARG